MTSDEFRSCIHPRELPRFLLALLFALPIALALLAICVVSYGLVLTYVSMIAFVVWIGFEITYANFLANWILVSEDNYPRLNGLLQEVRENIGVKQRVDIIVYQQGDFNAYFAMLFARRAIFLNSETLEQGVTDDELRWIIGRFVGRIRAKRRMGVLSWVIALAERLIVFNLFIYPYVRATAYSGDRVALATINGDITTAISAMHKLMVGRQLGYSVNPAGIVAQYRRVKGSLFAFLARLPSPLPQTLARYFDLVAFAAQRYPQEYQKFAAMNPSFETAGGPERLLYTTRLPTYAGQGLSSGAVGALLFFGAIGVGVVGFAALMAFGPPNFQDAFNPYGSYTLEEPASEYTAEDYGAAPAAEDAAAAVEAAAPAPTDTYGAFAISSSTLNVGSSWNWASAYEAEQSAMTSCAQSDCAVYYTHANTCAAISYAASDGLWGSMTGASLEDARTATLQTCQARTYDCQLVAEFCSWQQ